MKDAWIKLMKSLGFDVQADIKEISVSQETIDKMQAAVNAKADLEAKLATAETAKTTAENAKKTAEDALAALTTEKTTADAALVIATAKITTLEKAKAGDFRTVQQLADDLEKEKPNQFETSFDPEKAAAIAKEAELTKTLK